MGQTVEMAAARLMDHLPPNQPPHRTTPCRTVPRVDDPQPTPPARPPTRSYDLALDIFGARMPALSVAPDQDSFQSLLGACYGAREWRRAGELLLEMEQRGLPPSSISCR